jgi:hypothetical protein
MKERNETEDGERERRKGGKREESRRVKEETESYIYTWVEVADAPFVQVDKASMGEKGWV